MKRYNPSYLPIVFTALIASCGGGGGGSSSATATDTQSPVVVEKIGGSANKGILINAVVTAYPLAANGAVDLSNPLGATTTDSNGAYSLALSAAYDGGPVLIRTTANESTLMKCDIPSGCPNGIAFGNNYALNEAGFSLDALIAALPDSSEATITPTPLTDLASAIALDEIARLGEINATNISTEIVNASSRVANLFGVNSDLAFYKALDLTDTTEVMAELSTDNEFLIEYTAINAAIVDAIFKDNVDSGNNTTVNISEALNLFKTRFLGANGIPANSADTTITGLDEIYEAAQSVLVGVSDLDKGDDLYRQDFGGIRARFSANQRYLSAFPEGTVQSGVVSDTANLPPLLQAKAFASDLRNLSVVILGADVNGTTVEGLADNFKLQIEAAELLSRSDASVVSHALVSASEAITHAAKAYHDDNAITQFLVDDITVQIVEQPSVVTFTIDQPVGGVDTNLIARVDDYRLVDSTPFFSFRDQGQLSFDFSLSGIVQTSALRLTIDDESEVSVGLVDYGIQEANNWRFINVFDIEIEDLVFNLESSIESLDTIAPIAFNGAVNLNFDRIDIEDSYYYDYTYFDDRYRLNSRIYDSAIALSGTFANGIGENFRASLSLGFEIDVSVVKYFYQNSPTIDHETSYYDLSLMFNADLAGLRDAVVFELSLDESSRASDEIKLGIGYPGNQIYLRATVDDNELDQLTLVNQNRVMITIDENNTGFINVNGAPYATIEDGQFPIVRYSDGTFESL